MTDQDVQVLLLSIEARLARIEEAMKVHAVIERRVYTVDEVAEQVDRSPWTIRQLCNSELIPGSFKIGGRGHGEWRIPADALAKLLSEGVPQLVKGVTHAHQKIQRVPPQPGPCQGPIQVDHS